MKRLAASFPIIALSLSLILLTTNPLVAQYCAVSTPACENISRVTVGTIDNLSTSCSITSEGYSDYTSLSTNMIVGESYPITVINGQEDLTDQCAIWIDWNNDGDFTDAGKLITMTGSPGIGPYTAIITPPVGVTEGIKRMRIRISWNITPTPCEQQNFSEVEDYSINIVSNTPMEYETTIVTQPNTSNVLTCGINQEIIKIEVITSGSTTPFDITKFIVQTAGSTDSGILNNVSNIDLFYTGSNSTFSPIGLFASMSPQLFDGEINFNGSQTLQSGSNYFWIAYDMNGSSATPSHVVDAKLTKITVNGTIRTIGAGDPTGSRTIVACINAPGGVSENNTFWIKGATDITKDASNRVSQWGSVAQSDAITLAQGDSDKQPSFQEANPDFNYNPHIKFDGVNDELFKDYKYLDPDRLGDSGTVIIVSNAITNPSSSGSDETIFAYQGGYSQDYQIKPKINCGFGFPTGASPKFQMEWDNILSPLPTPDSRPQIIGLRGGQTPFGFRNGTYKTSSNVTDDGAHVGSQLTLGSRGIYDSEYSPASLAEVILYKRQLTTNELDRVQSYLAIKYGITLGTNGTSKNYYSAGGNVIWDISENNGFNYDIAGIGRDDIGGLDQKKSHSVNGSSGSTYNDILTISSGVNTEAPTPFSGNASYLVWGRNDQPAEGDYFLDVQAPIQTRLMRVWKAQETGNVGMVTLEFNMNQVPGNEGLIPNDLNEVRLLVSTTNNFGGSTTSIEPSFVNNENQIVRFQHDFNAASGFYFTIGSVNLNLAPLPVTLSEFKAKCKDHATELNWTTQSETNNAFFTVEKSTDARNFKSVATIEGHGTSTSTINYSWIDKAQPQGTTYYRLKQTDYDGAYEYHDVVSINCREEFPFLIYPNPTKDRVFIQHNSASDSGLEIEVYNVLGEIVYRKEILDSGWINLPDAQGIYFIRVKDDDKFYVEKVVKN